MDERVEASLADVLALKEEIQQTVEARFGVRLLPEPVMVGFGNSEKSVESGE